MVEGMTRLLPMITTMELVIAMEKPRHGVILLSLMPMDLKTEGIPLGIETLTHTHCMQN